MAAPTPAPPRLKASRPDGFDGARANYDTFRRQLSLYMSLDGAGATDQAKVMMALSYMTTGFAAEWANAKYKEYEPAAYPSWANFMTAMDEAFIDTSDKEMARTELMQLQQKFKETASEWHTRFETIALRAGYNTTRHGDYLIPIYKAGTKRSIIAKIYDTGNLPVDYAGWKALVQRINDAYHQFRQLDAHRTAPVPAPAPSSKPKRRSDETAARPYGYMGVPGEPMQGVQAEQRAKRRREGLCYKCGQKWNPAHKCETIRAAAAAAEVTHRNAEISRIARDKNDDSLMDSLKEMMKNSGKKDF